MNNTVVIYKSKYGSTKKYAQWLAEALSCDLFERSEIKCKQMQKYDIIIYGGGLYAGGVSGIDLITKSFDSIKNKTLILFTCGLADTSDTTNIKNIKQSLSKILTSEMQDKIKVFNLRGAIDYSKLGIVHKSMMSMFRKIILKKDYSTLKDEDKQIIDTYGQAVDFTDKNSIKPIIDYVKGL